MKNIEKLNLSTIPIKEHSSEIDGSKLNGGQMEDDLNLEGSFSEDFSANNESILSVFPPTKLAPNQTKVVENRQKEIFENELRELLKLLGTVRPGELQYGIRKMFNPRTKLIEGAGMISMKTLQEYNEQINNIKQSEEKNKVTDSLSFIKENQLNFHKKNNEAEILLDKNLNSSASFLKTSESHVQNTPLQYNPKRSLAINAGKLIIKCVNTGHLLMNEFEIKQENSLNTQQSENIRSGGLARKEMKKDKSDETQQNMSSLFKSISGIEDRTHENFPEQSMNILSSSQQSLFLGAGKTLLNKIDDEYLKIIHKKNLG